MYTVSRRKGNNPEARRRITEIHRKIQGEPNKERGKAIYFSNTLTCEPGGGGSLIWQLTETDPSELID